MAVLEVEDETLYNAPIGPDGEGKALLHDIVENLDADDWVFMVRRKGIPRRPS